MNILVKTADTQRIDNILEMLYELGRPRLDDIVNDSGDTGNMNNAADMFRDIIGQYITDQDKTILVAVNNGVVIGMASIIFLSRLNYITKEMYIPELIVTRDFRDQHIGSKLINSCIQLAKQHNCHRIRLESGNQRKSSHKFYNHMGFEQNALSFVLNVSYP